MADLDAIVKQLTKLAPVNSSPGNLRSGTVSLFAHPSWTSPRYDIILGDHTSEDRHLLPRNAVDNTTWVAWNVPVGTVVTLTDHYRARDSNKSVGDLEGLGASVDLVGTGKTETTDLTKCDMNDIVATFFWRDVDLRYGAVEMFCDPKFTGIRQTLFLSEWTPGVTYNLPGSHLNDRMTSIRWRSLKDNQKVVFLEHPHGGNAFVEAKGWGSVKENGDLRNVRFDDCVSAFRWNPVLPVKEVIQPIKIDAPTGNTNSQTAVESYENGTNVEQTFKVTWSQSESKSLTIATTQTHVAGVKGSITTKTSGGIGAIKSEVSHTLELSYQYTNSTTKTEAKTEVATITYERTVIAAPRGTTTATMTLQISKVPERTYQTTATRWYQEQVSGSVRDPSNQGLWKREEKTYVTISGGLATSLVTKTSFEPYK